MKVTCIICYELLLASEDIHTAPCGHMLHFHCWIEWLQRNPNCPECRKSTHPNQLIRLYFNAGEDDDYATLSNKYDSLRCELQCKISEVEAANELLQKQERDCKSLRLEVRALKGIANDLNGLMGNLNPEEDWFAELQDYKEQMSRNMERKDAEIKKYQMKLQEFELQAKQRPVQKTPRGSDTALTAEERRSRHLRRLPRGCVLHLSIPPFWKGDHPDIRRAIERLGGRVAFVTFKRGDLDAYVRLHVGLGNPARKFMAALPRPSIVIDDLVMFPRILEGEEEMQFLKKSLEDRDKRQEEQLRRRDGTNSAVGASSAGPSGVTVHPRVNSTVSASSAGPSGVTVRPRVKSTVGASSAGPSGVTVRTFFDVYPRVETVSEERVAQPVKDSVISDVRDYVSSLFRAALNLS